MSRILASRTLHAIAFVMLYLLLLVEYYRFVYGYFFSIMGFDFQLLHLPFIEGLLLLLFLGGILFYVPSKSGRLYFLSLFASLLFCLPQIIMFQIGKASPWGAIYSVLLVVLLQSPILRLPQFRIARVGDRTQRWLMPALAAAAMIPFVLSYGFHFDFSLFSLGSNTYDRRAEAVAAGNIFTAYLMGPLCKVMLPMLLLWGMLYLRRYWWAALLAMSCMLYLFMVSPQKSILFSIAIVILCGFFKDAFVKSGVLLLGVLALCAGVVLLNVATGHVMAESIVVRRLFFIPALVTDSYFAFFDHHPILLSHSFLHHFFEYPYTLDPSHLIGKMMYNRSITSCNTGIVADGFMNFGHLGAIFFVFIGAFLFHLMESVDYDSRYLGLVVLLLFAFLNGALFTSLLTHGGWLLLLVVLFFIPRRKELI